MTDRIRLKLIELSRLQTTWTYTQLNDSLELGFDFDLSQDRDTIGELLGEVSEHEFENNRPLLSVLITHKHGRREQGDGFYKLCERLYGDRDWTELKKDKKWEKGLIADCFEFWLDPDNYKKYKNDY